MVLLWIDMEEQWKIGKYKGIYYEWLLVSNKGIVKNRDTGIIYRHLSKHYKTYDCLYVQFKYNNQKHYFSLPLLVFTTFSDIDISNKYEFKYKDNNFENCSYDNLITLIGEKRISKQGYLMECIGYERYNKVLIRFEDGMTRTKELYKFMSGDVYHPLCPNKWNKEEFYIFLNTIYENQYGWKYRIIEFRTLNDIDIIFLDGGDIVRNVTHERIKKRNIENPSKYRLPYEEYNTRIKLKVFNRINKECKIFKYRSGEDIDIIFKDGAIARNKTFYNFINGRIAHPNDVLDEDLKKMTAGERYIYSQYKSGAKARGYEFNLGIEDFISLIHSSKCYYCGQPYYNKNIDYYGKELEYIGIDRKDNTKGYNIDNCVPCCVICNLAKSSLPYDQWIDWLGNIANNYINIKNDKI